MFNSLMPSLNIRSLPFVVFMGGFPSRLQDLSSGAIRPGGLLFKFKIENFTKMKKRSRDIHPRNIPTDFEKDPKIGCWVTGVDGPTDRPTDRPTTRHGNRSSGPKNKWTIQSKTYRFYHYLYYGWFHSIIIYLC